MPRDVQLFLKRLRKAISPVALRFYLVGEYGDKTERPHYHLALYGIDRKYSEVVHKEWGKGHTYLGDLTYESAQYIAGYVTKKLTNPNDERLNGRYPEFARMSNRPGIGALAIKDIAKSLVTVDGEILGCGEDVPSILQHGKRKFPLGRYLRMKLRKELGYANTGAQPFTAYKRSVELQALFTAALETSPDTSFKEVLINRYLGKVRSIEARSKIFAQKKVL